METMSLAGRVALVTGGARRVGRGIALALGAAGVDVVVHHRRSHADADAVVAELRALGRRAWALQGDLGDPGTPARLCAEALAAAGRLDILVNSAGPFTRVPFLDGDEAAWEAAWQESLALTVMAPARLARQAAAALSAGSSPGVIVNILDIAAYQAWPSYLHHATAKAALAHMTRGLAAALAPGVRVVGVAPGIVDWPDELSDEARRKLVARVPLGRAGTPADVGQAVVSLCQADYVTGSVLVVDGGRLVAAGD
jgi:pteridine reductase